MLNEKEKEVKKILERFSAELFRTNVIRKGRTIYKYVVEICELGIKEREMLMDENGGLQYELGAANKEIDDLEAMLEVWVEPHVVIAEGEIIVEEDLIDELLEKVDSKKGKLIFIEGE